MVLFRDSSWLPFPLSSRNLQDAADPRSPILGLAGQHADVVRCLELTATVRMPTENQKIGGGVLLHHGPHDVAHDLTGKVGQIIVLEGLP